MTLVNTTKMLEKARAGKYAVGAFNIVNLDMVRAIISAAEKENSPVIIQFAEVHEQFVPLEVIAPIMVREAERASVPVAVHLDHGNTYEYIVRAMHLGFTSVMIDGAAFPFEENVEVTKEIVKVAHALNVSVESELGAMLNSDTSTEKSDEEIDPDQIFTDPTMAKDFVEATDTDILAISFGTVHGIPLAEPNLDFERLQAIADSTPVPLVMHGGSGSAVDEYKSAVKRGVSKINYYSDMAYKTSVKINDKMNTMIEAGGKPFLNDLLDWTLEFVEEEVSTRMKDFNSSGKA